MGKSTYMYHITRSSWMNMQPLYFLDKLINQPKPSYQSDTAKSKKRNIVQVASFRQPNRRCNLCSIKLALMLILTNNHACFLFLQSVSTPLHFNECWDFSYSNCAIWLIVLIGPLYFISLKMILLIKTNLCWLTCCANWNVSSLSKAEVYWS